MISAAFMAGLNCTVEPMEAHRERLAACGLRARSSVPTKTWRTAAHANSLHTTLLQHLCHFFKNEAEKKIDMASR